MLLFVGATLTGCNQFIDPEINVDPDRPVENNLELGMSAIQTRMGYTTIGGNDIARHVNMWTQQITGYDRQSLTTTNYIVRAEDGNNYWNANYAGTMMDIYLMKQLAVEKGSPHFEGAANILMALSLGHTSDVFGDIPFNEAFQGADGLAPTYESQEKIYETIDDLLAQAVELLQKDAGPIPLVSQFDFIFGGDPAKWLNAAYGLQARFAIHRTKLDDKYYAQAKAAAEKYSAANAMDMQFDFYKSAGQDNPFYQFQTQRGDNVSCATIIDIMKKEYEYNGAQYRDPRLPVYVYPLTDTVEYDGMKYYPGEFVGIRPGESRGDLCYPGDAVAAQDAPVIFMSAVEMNFVLAEVALKNGEDGLARDHILDGMANSFNKWNADSYNTAGYSADYIAAYTPYLNTLTGSDLFKEMMIQKYLGLYFQLEVYNDVRRSENVIGLIPPEGLSAPNNVIPRRYLYPTDEVDLNPNTPKGVGQNDRVWWDKKP